MWMIYGANGYSGELIAREAARRGLTPILAGRNRAAVAALGTELGLGWRAFPLEAAQLEGIELVLHCAGPFIHTSRPMVDACLAAGAHYLDITGEIAVFEAIFARDEEAKRQGVTLLPGVGFDVVPTDCLAAQLKELMPDAEELWLAFQMRGGSVSRGTLKTMIEGIGEGGAIRRDGRITRVPLVFDAREIPFPSGPRMAMTIPWGDIATAWRTTGIPNLRVYSAQSPRSIAQTKRIARLAPFLALKPVRRVLQAIASRRSGPDEEARNRGRIDVWGKVRNAAGAEITRALTTPEGYRFTMLSALAAVERVLAETKAGAWTPASLFGSGFVRSIEGVEEA
jgi:short subunit dehydrogenase-like uncharacterized protein